MVFEGRTETTFQAISLPVGLDTADPEGHRDDENHRLHLDKLDAALDQRIAHEANCQVASYSNNIITCSWFW
jgi:hypothetical protein